MSEPSADAQPEARIVRLSGIQTVTTIEETRRLVLQALAAAEAVEIDCTAVAEADLTLLQVLLAARQSAARSGKALSLKGAAAGAMAAALRDAGFGPLDSFWQGETQK